MLAPLLMMTLLQGTAPLGGLSRASAPDAAPDPSVVVLDCEIANGALSHCDVLGDVAKDQATAAVKSALAQTVPDEVLEAGVSRVRLRLRIPVADAASQSGTNEH